MFGDFDEAAYLRANPDVRGMVERGIFRSGFEHWHAVGAKEHALGDRASGFLEHDLMYDEAAYLKQNPDVAHAVRTRAVRNGYQHWIRFGRPEFVRGTRLGPFKANGVLRAFMVPTTGGALFVSRAPEDFGRAERVEVRVGSNAPLPAGVVSAECSGPVRLVDACGDAVKLRLLVAMSSKGLDLESVPLGTRIRVTVHSERGSVTSTFSDRGVQAFSFLAADDANEFMATARTAGRCESTHEPVLDFALARLASSPRRLGYEKPLTFRIENVSAGAEGGLSVSGWVALTPDELSSFRAWRPRAAEFLDLTGVWSRLSRPDVLERFPELRARGTSDFGFQAVLRFARPYPSGEEKILFGAAKNGLPEEWIEFGA